MTYPISKFAEILVEVKFISSGDEKPFVELLVKGSGVFERINDLHDYQVILHVGDTLHLVATGASADGE
jgi:hypothetical protein